MSRLKLDPSEAFQYIVLLFCAGVAFLAQSNVFGRVAVVLVYSALLGIYGFWPFRYNAFYLSVQLALIVLACWLDSIGFILGFTFSAYAMIIAPGWLGAAWVMAAAAAVGGMDIIQSGFNSGVLTLFSVMLGYSAFGYAYYTRDQALAERKKSQALLDELQQAHARLKEYADRVQDLAVSEERNRLAREMHDTLGHRLTVSAVQLEGALRLISSDPQKAARLVSTVREQVVAALAELRQTVATLRSPLEADLPLTTALARLAAAFEQATGLPVHLDLADHLPSLSDAQHLALYRATQEGLTNLQRHAHASQAWLRLALDGENLVLQVMDDGDGFPPGTLSRDPGDSHTAGFGLYGLRERAAHLGGELCLENRPEGGGRLWLCLPLVPLNPTLEKPGGSEMTAQKGCGCPDQSV